MILVGISCQVQMFPVYNNLADSSTESGMIVFSKSVMISSFIYLLIGMMGVFLFGSGVQDSVLNNIGA